MRVAMSHHCRCKSKIQHPKEEDEVQSHFRSTTSDLDSDMEHRAVKRVVDWILAIEEIRAKCQCGEGL